MCDEQLCCDPAFRSSTSSLNQCSSCVPRHMSTFHACHGMFSFLCLSFYPILPRLTRTLWLSARTLHAHKELHAAPRGLFMQLCDRKQWKNHGRNCGKAECWCDVSEVEAPTGPVSPQKYIWFPDIGFLIWHLTGVKLAAGVQNTVCVCWLVWWARPNTTTCWAPSCSLPLLFITAFNSPPPTLRHTHIPFVPVYSIYNDGIFKDVIGTFLTFMTSI